MYILVVWAARLLGSPAATLLTDENGLRVIDFDAFKKMAIRSPFFLHSFPYLYTWRLPHKTESQNDPVVVDGRRWSDIIDIENLSWCILCDYGATASKTLHQ